MMCCKSDVAYAIGQVSKYMGKPSKKYWNTMKYLAGIKNYGLLLGLKEESDEGSTSYDPLLGYVDSDYVGDRDTRMSTFGLVFTLFRGTVL